MFVAIFLDASTTFVFSILKLGYETNHVLADLLAISPFFCFPYLFLWGFLVLLFRLRKNAENGIAMNRVLLHGMLGVNNLALILSGDPIVINWEKSTGIDLYFPYVFSIG